MLKFNEDLLHYVWRLQYFNFSDLTNTENQKVHIVHPGYHNLNAGPDFLEAKVKINDTLWNGNIEIHIRSSEWLEHLHQNDPAYDNVILHVVYENDKEIKRADGSIIPTIELRHRISRSIFDRYFSLKDHSSKIPCESQIEKVDSFSKKLFVESLAVHRLERKCGFMEELLNHSNGNWEAGFYLAMGKYFGGKVNAEAFYLLVKSIPIEVIYKNRDQASLIEALLFGQSGFLKREFKDAYPKQLKNDYKFLSRKYNLDPIDAKLWKFFRMRPSGFPTIRIAQFSQLLTKKSMTFSNFLDLSELHFIWKIFDITPHDYWYDHYFFDKPASSKLKKPGNQFVNTLLINAILPYLFFYAKQRQLPELAKRIIELYTRLKPEKNKFTRFWKDFGMENKNALDSQGLIELKNEYCDKHLCLQCAIGHKLINMK